MEKTRDSDQDNRAKLSVFEVLILLMGMAVAYFGFVLINNQFKQDFGITWEMIIAIFLWLMLITIFVFLGMVVDTQKRSLQRFHDIKFLIEDHIANIEIAPKKKSKATRRKKR